MVGLVGVKARVQRTGFQVVLARKTMKGRSKSKRESRSTRERERERESKDAPHPLNYPILALPMSRVSVAMPMFSDISFI